MGAMTGVVVAGMLFFGTCTVVIQKVILSMWGWGKKNENGSSSYHQFSKPWFQTEAMFIGMFGCLAVYEVMRCVQRSKAKKAAREGLSETDPLVNSSDSAKENKKPEIPVWKQYCLVCLPALCDMCATAMMNIGLLWIAPSVWQMLRGSMVIFSACFSKFFLKRNLHASHWTGVGVVAFSLVVVAFAALMQPARPRYYNNTSSDSKITPEESSSNPAKEVSTGQVALGCALVVIAQIIQASQIVIEEHLLKNICLHPVLVVGLEGMWGTISCSILLCFTSFIPAEYGGEDAIDTLIMFFTNGDILGLGIFYAAVILCYNLFGMFVTSYTSAVLRTILEGLRCACIWIVNMIIFYCIVYIGKKDTDFGEFWNDWSYLQFCGFLFLLLGMFVYNGIVRIDGMYYEAEDPFVCNIASKMSSNKKLSDFAKDKKFLGEMAEFQGRDKVMAIKERLLTVPGMDDVKLQTLEAMVGITPRMIDDAKNRWDAEAQKKQGDAYVEVSGDTSS